MKISKNLMSRNHTALKRSKADIKYIVCHYVGALGDAKANTDYYKSTNVGASADFWVGFFGDVWQGNDYWNYYSWHCGGGLQGSGGASFYQKCTNRNSVGIEMCVRKKSTKTMNATDKDWYFEAATIESTAKLVAHLMQELDVDIDHVIRHYDVNGKICPNPFVYDTGNVGWKEFKKKVMKYYNGDQDKEEVSIQYYVRLSWNNKNSQLGAYSVLENAKKECDKHDGYKVFDGNGKVVYENKVDASDYDKIWMGWVKRESGGKGYRCVNGDRGKAQGAFQFDYRYALVPFMQFCVDHSPSHYNGFKQYIAYGAGNSKLINNSSLASLWISYCDKYEAEFSGLQDTYAYNHYYLEAKKYIKNLYDIKMDDHSPAVKGSLFSMAIRSGALTGARKFNGCNNSTSDSEMLRKAYSTYGNEDANRWTKAGQYGDAIKALNNNEYSLIKKNGISTTPSKPEKPELNPEDNKPYRVGTGWKDGKCVNQHGAFDSLDNAKADAERCASLYKKKYKVFDKTGKKIYVAKPVDKPVFRPYSVRVTTSDLRIRKTPGGDWTGKYTGIGVFGIVAEQKVGSVTWGRLKSDAGWISLDYAQKI